MLAVSPHKHPLLRPHIPPTQSDFGALDSRTLPSVTGSLPRGRTGSWRWCTRGCSAGGGEL